MSIRSPDEIIGTIFVDNSEIPFATIRQVFENRHKENLRILVKGDDGCNLTFNYKELATRPEVVSIIQELLAEEKARRIQRTQGQQTAVTMDVTGVIKLINSTFSRTFSGDAAELQGFLINIQICKKAIPQNHEELAVSCIRGHLTGKADALINDDVKTYDRLTEIFKTHIKRDSTKVIEAKLRAITFDYHNLSKYTEEVNKISDQLITTYIQDGIPLQKANEMTVEQVTDTCRRSARNDLVKSVLASSSFDTPKDVLSKFTTEIAKANQDKKFLAYSQQPARGRGFNRGNYRPLPHFRRNQQDWGRQEGYQPREWYQPRDSFNNGNRGNYRGAYRGGQRGGYRGGQQGRQHYGNAVRSLHTQQDEVDYNQRLN